MILNFLQAPLVTLPRVFDSQTPHRKTTSHVKLLDLKGQKKKNPNTAQSPQTQVGYLGHLISEQAVLSDNPFHPTLQGPAELILSASYQLM